MIALILTILLFAELLSIIVIALLGMPSAGYWCAGIAAVGILTACILYQLVVRPLRTLTIGADLLLGQDFGSRLRGNGPGEIDRLAGLFNQMMDTLHRERLAVRETNRYLDLLVASSPMGVLNFDYDGYMVMANKSALAMLGAKNMEELRGLPQRRLPGRLGHLIATLAVGSSATLEARPDQGEDNIYRVTKFTFIDYGFPRVAVLIEKLTDVIRQTERQAYDKLIRVMAHEINNSMGAVTSTFDLLAEMPEIAGDEDLLPLIDSCGHRCRSLCNFVDRYASVARLPQPQKTEMEVNTLLERCEPVLSHTASLACTGARLILRQDRPLTVMLDPVLMEQVLVNIVKNAAESIAIKPVPQGRILISTDSKDRTLTVCDDGAGIDTETSQQLFTPFFSTKRSNSTGGTGLTLAAEILRSHGFRFSLRTDPTDGQTRFRIYFGR